MRDWIATIVGIVIFILGLTIYLSPENFKVYVAILPMTLVSIIVFALATLLIVTGIISYISDKLSKD